MASKQTYDTSRDQQAPSIVEQVKKVFRRLVGIIIANGLGERGRLILDGHADSVLKILLLHRNANSRLITMQCRSFSISTMMLAVG